MTKQEVLDAVEKAVHYNGRRGSGTDPEEIELEGVAFTVEESTGGEGQGDTVTVVLKVTVPHDMYIFVSGSYNSNEGCDWSYADVSEVVPYEKTVRDWKSV